MNNNREILKKYLDVYKTQIFTKQERLKKNANIIIVAMIVDI